MKTLLRFTWLSLGAVASLAVVALALSLPAPVPLAAGPRDTPSPAVTPTPVASLYLPALQRTHRLPDPVGQWTRYTLPDAPPTLNKIVMSNSSLGWAIGFTNSSGAIWRFDGERWNAETIPVVGELRDLSVVSPTDIWAAGAWNPTSGALLHWDGLAWSKAPQPEPQPVCEHEAVLAFSASDVWLTSLCGRSDMVDGIYHWDGSGWTLSHDTTHDFTLTRFSSTGPNDVWVRGDGNATLHWNGSAWRSFGGPDNVQLGRGISMSTPTDGWKVDGNASCSLERFGPPCQSTAWMVHWDGIRWVDHTFFSDHADLDVQAISPSLAWAVGGTATGYFEHEIHSGSLDKWDGQSWRLVATGPGTFLTHLSVLGTNDIWATGADGAIYHYPAP